MFFSKITRHDLAEEMWRSFWTSQVKTAFIVILRIVWARLRMSVCVGMLRSLADGIGLTGYGILVNTSLIATMNSVPLRGEPREMPLDC